MIGNSRPRPAHPLEQLQTVHRGHALVGQHQVEVGVLQLRASLATVRGRHDLEAGPSQDVGQHHPLWLLVVDDQQAASWRDLAGLLRAQPTDLLVRAVAQRQRHPYASPPTGLTLQR